MSVNVRLKIILEGERFQLLVKLSREWKSPLFQARITQSRILLERSQQISEWTLILGRSWRSRLGLVGEKHR